MKTFLGHEKVIFIIPIDDKGLKSYLQMSNKDADEFLRKLFNVSITIKSFSPNELYDFCVKLWDKYGINLPEKETVISLICQEFSKNPRRIIQFLNTLQVEYNLALLQEEKGLIPRGSITDNIEMLVKLLIIREEYPNLYERIIDDKSLLQTITEDIKAGKFKKDNEKRLWTNETIELTEEEYRFFMRTSNIVLDAIKLEPFFVLKDIFKDIPDEIENLVISQDWNSIKGYIESGQISLEKLLNFIETKIDEDVIKRKLYDTTGFNLLSLILKIIAEKKEKIGILPNKIISSLNIRGLWKNPFSYPYKELSISLKWLKDKQIIEPLDYIIEAINGINIEKLGKDRNPIQLLREFLNVFKQDTGTISRIKNKFSEIMAQNFSFYNDFKDIINSEVVKDLFDNNFVGRIIPTLSQDFNQNQTNEKVEIIKSLNEYDALDKASIDQFVNRCIQNAGNLQSYQNWNIFSFWLEALKDFVRKIDDNNVLNNFYNFLYQNYNFLIQQYNSRNLGAEQIKCYKFFINIIGEFYLSNNSSNYRESILGWINAFLNPIHLEVYSTVNEVYRKIIGETENWQPFAQHLISHLINQNDWNYKKIITETINEMLLRTDENKGLSSQQINQILQHYLGLYINTNNDEVKNHIIKISKKEFIGSKVIELIINYLTPETGNKMLPIINELIDKYGFDRFYPKVRELLASTELKKQELGIKLVNIVKEKIPDDKKPTIKQLLFEIDSKELSDEARGKLKDLKNYL